jgi:hypothetical protein
MSAGSGASFSLVELAGGDDGDGVDGGGGDVVEVDVVVAVDVIDGGDGTDAAAAVVATADFAVVFALPEASFHSFRILLSRFKTSALAFGTLHTPSEQSAPAGGGGLLNAYIAPLGVLATPVLTSSNVAMTESMRTITLSVCVSGLCPSCKAHHLMTVGISGSLDCWCSR